MSKKWFVFAGEDSLADVISAIRKEHPDDVIYEEKSAADLRRRLRMNPGAKVAVGPAGSDVTAVNVAAAVAADGYASHVELVCRQASGSLKSRARKAGIDRLLVLGRKSGDVTEEPAKAPAHIREVEEERVSAAADLDEPEFIEDVAAPVIPAKDAQDSQAMPVLPAVIEGGKREVKPSGMATHEKQGAPIFCVASGRGGVGKTTVAALLALAAASWNARVALVDLDLASGNLGTYFGKSHPSDLAKLSQVEHVSYGDVEPLGMSVHEGVSVFGSCELPEMAETLEGRVTEMLRALSQNYDLVVVDCSTACTDAVAQALQICDRLLLIADEKARAIGSLSRMSALAVRLGVARTRIVRVMNGCDPKGKDEPILYRGEIGLETARVFRLDDAGEVVRELEGIGRIEEVRTEAPVLMRQAEACCAALLSELGRLPEVEAAEKALDFASRKPKRNFFGRMREAV